MLWFIQYGSQSRLFCNPAFSESSLDKLKKASHPEISDACEPDWMINTTPYSVQVVFLLMALL